MAIYYIYILFCVLLWPGLIRSANQKKQFVRVSSIVLLLMIGLRSNTMGTDTYSYCRTFLNFQYYGWDYLLSADYSSNYGFSIFQKLLSIVSPNSYSLFLIVVAAMITGSVAYFYYRFSLQPLMSTIMMISLGFVAFYMSGIKQTLAMAILFFAYGALRDRKIVKFIVLVLLAAMFHNSALVFLLAWPICTLKLKRKIVVLIPVAVLIALQSGTEVFSFIKAFLGDEYYAAYGTVYISENSLTGLVIQLTIFSVSVFLLWKNVKDDTELSDLLSIYGIGMFFQAFTPVLAEFFRISMYFSVYGTILLPYALENISERRTRIIAYWGCSLVFILYFIFFNPAFEYSCVFWS